MSEAVAGKLHVANDVLADMVGHVALNCAGIAGLTAAVASGESAKILPKSRMRKGVVVAAANAGVHIDVYVVLNGDCNINATSQNMVEQITSVLTEQARVPLDGIDVHVQAIKE